MPIPLSEARGWIVDPQTGDVRHESGEFFIVHGIRVKHTPTREVGESGWDQPIITQVGYDGGIAGLLRRRVRGVPHYLINAKAEPGNPGRLQLSPTMLATFSNLRMAHGGKKPPFAEFFEQPDSARTRMICRKWITEDGGRFNLKRNLAMVIEVYEDVRIERDSDFRWLSMYQIKDCMQRDAWVNPDLAAIVAGL
jgi:oxidase EvaA